MLLATQLGIYGQNDLDILLIVSILFGLRYKNNEWESNQSTLDIHRQLEELHGIDYIHCDPGRVNREAVKPRALTLFLFCFGSKLASERRYSSTFGKCRMPLFESQC
jgi:hypothetical protein